MVVAKGGETSGDYKPDINAFMTEQPEHFLDAGENRRKLFYSQHLIAARPSLSKFV